MSSTESASSSDESESPVSPHTSHRKSGPSRVKASRPVDQESSSGDSGQSSSESESEEETEDPQVLSRAEKRRQKKKEAKTRTESKGEGKEAPSKASSDVPPSKVPKRQNSVWVGNLSFKTSVEALKKFFAGVGEITRVHMPTKVVNAGPNGKAKENIGYAYVDFASPDAKVVAITLSENPLDGRRLLIKDGGDFTGRPSNSQSLAKEDGSSPNQQSLGTTKTAQKILRSQKQPPGPTLFFGNLGFETIEQTIREMLEHHHKANNPEEGEKWIRKIRMGTFEDSGKCKGWAFVDFTNPEHATTTLTNPRNHHLNGRQLVVEYASPEAVRRGGGGPRPEKNAKQPPQRTDGPTKRKSRTDAGEDNGEQERDMKNLEKKRRVSQQKDEDPRPTNFVVKHPGKRARPKPGAALAQAKRETAAIVPSQGQRIVF